MTCPVKRSVQVFLCVYLSQCLLSLKVLLYISLCCLDWSYVLSLTSPKIPVWIHCQLLYWKLIKWWPLVWCHRVRKIFQSSVCEVFKFWHQMFWTMGKAIYLRILCVSLLLISLVISPQFYSICKPNPDNWVVPLTLFNILVSVFCWTNECQRKWVINVEVSICCKVKVIVYTHCSCSQIKMNC